MNKGETLEASASAMLLKGNVEGFRQATKELVQYAAEGGTQAVEVLGFLREKLEEHRNAECVAASVIAIHDISMHYLNTLLKGELEIDQGKKHLRRDFNKIDENVVKEAMDVIPVALSTQNAFSSIHDWDTYKFSPYDSISNIACKALKYRDRISQREMVGFSSNVYDILGDISAECIDLLKSGLAKDQHHQQAVSSLVKISRATDDQEAVDVLWILQETEPSEDVYKGLVDAACGRINGNSEEVFDYFLNAQDARAVPEMIRLCREYPRATHMDYTEKNIWGGFKTRMFESGNVFQNYDNYRYLNREMTKADETDYITLKMLLAVHDNLSTTPEKAPPENIKILSSAIESAVTDIIKPETLFSYFQLGERPEKKCVRAAIAEVSEIVEMPEAAHAAKQALRVYDDAYKGYTQFSKSFGTQNNGQNPSLDSGLSHLEP